MIVSFKPTFLRQYKRLIPSLQQEIKEKIALFKENPTHPFLKTHKLQGHLKGKYSFSINYAFRIIFEYESKDEVVLLYVGNHKIYD